jgi:hypothetical protein
MHEPVINANEFIRNCNAHSLEELAPFEGQYVAWSIDGRRILAHAEREEDLYAEIDRLGIKDQCVIDFIPPFDEAQLGGAGML